MDSTKTEARQWIRDRRIVLALSWLSVEDIAGSPEQFRVEANKGDSEPATVEALRKILELRGKEDSSLDKQQISEWVDDCRASLSASIRKADEAFHEDPDQATTWVNRSAAFDSLRERIGPSHTRRNRGTFLNASWGARKPISSSRLLMVPIP